MSDELPAPLVPAYVDLRGLEWMPYYGEHLVTSDLDLKANDAVFRAAHYLWWSAWHSVPAASLPNERRALARCARVSRRSDATLTQAMHGFVLCTDGRWYHRFLAQLAISAWEKLEHQRDRKQRWRLRNRSEDGDGTVRGTGTERFRNGGEKRREEYIYKPSSDSGPPRAREPEPQPPVTDEDRAYVHALVNGAIKSMNSAIEPPDTPENRKERLRQKLCRYVQATCEPEVAAASIAGLAGDDPDHPPQWWFDMLDKRMRGEGWNDRAQSQWCSPEEKPSVGGQKEDGPP